MDHVQHLYHGSQVPVDTLRPRPGRGFGPDEHRCCAVYASQDPLLAIPFALPILPEENGRCEWTLAFCGNVPRIEISHGYLDLTGVGYLYRVCSEGFERLDEWQWVCYTEVEPVDYAVIYPRDFVGWVVRRQMRVKEGADT